MISNCISFVRKNRIIEIKNPDPNETLLNYIREKLKKTGSKVKSINERFTNILLIVFYIYYCLTPIFSKTNVQTRHEYVHASEAYVVYLEKIHL